MAVKYYSLQIKNMRIAILTSGILPIPAVLGGAVENLIDFYMDYNNRLQLHDITVYSIYNDAIKKHPALHSAVNHYHYIEVNSLKARILKIIFHLTRRYGKEYYHYSIEYFLLKALKHIRKNRYDVLILENRPGFALKLPNNIKAKVIYHLHNDFLNNDIPQAISIYKIATRIITVSDYITSRVKTINPLDQKCITVHNGINLDAFTSITNQLQRETLGLHRDDFVLIFSGRLIPEKGILPLIETMQLLKEQTNIKLLVLGNSSLGNSIEPSSFLQQIQIIAENLDNIIFTGYVDYKKMGNYLQLADVAVLPSLWDEPFGLTCVEAMAAGLPIITTRRGGIPEVVDDNCAILLDTANDLTHHLAATILQLCQNPEKCKAMKKSALIRSKYFSQELYSESFFKALL